MSEFIWRATKVFDTTDTGANMGGGGLDQHLLEAYGHVELPVQAHEHVELAQAVSADDVVADSPEPTLSPTVEAPGAMTTPAPAHEETVPMVEFVRTLKEIAQEVSERTGIPADTVTVDHIETLTPDLVTEARAAVQIRLAEKAAEEERARSEAAIAEIFGGPESVEPIVEVKKAAAKKTSPAKKTPKK